jgi:hypothetical protein
MERPATILDVLVSPTGKWIVIFAGVITVSLLFIIFAPQILSNRIDTKLIPRKEKDNNTKS